MQTYPPGTRIGQYEIASLPMMGGMGVVYFALDHGNDGRPVAIKTFRPELLPNREARDRFLREGTAWIELGSHPHIVRCYKVEYIDPTAFLVLELIAKEQNIPDASLRSWLIPGHPLPLEQALLFALQIARGMQHATEKIPGFVHRDLKPENILVGADRLPGTNINRLRVTDFGLAITLKDKLGKIEDSVDAKSTQTTHNIVGTPFYMAPEQWDNENVGVHTDLYAFGCILYEMLSGQRIVDGNTVSQLKEAHCAGRLRAFPDTLPKELCILLAKCLVLNAEQRLASWGQLTKAIEYTYLQQSGLSVPDATESSVLNRDERRQMGWSYNSIGVSYLDMGKVETALGHIEKAVLIARDTGDRRGEKNSLGNFGSAYLMLGDTQRAITCYKQTLAVAREIGDWQGEGDHLGNLGTVYTALGDFRRAIGYHGRALSIARKLGDQNMESRNLNNLGNAYFDLGEKKRAIEYYKNALAIDCSLGNQRGEEYALGSLGMVYASMNDVQKAVGYFEQSLAISRAIGDLRTECITFGNLGQLYANQGDHGKALTYYERELMLCRELNDTLGLARNSLKMARLHLGTGNCEKALSLAQYALHAYEQIGHAEYSQQSRQLVMDSLDLMQAKASPTELSQAFVSFDNANTMEEMRQVVKAYPYLITPNSIWGIEIISNDDTIPLEVKQSMGQRIKMLKLIAYGE